MPMAAAGAGISLMSQFSGSALWSIGVGLVSIVVPLFANYVFRILPLLGIYYGVRAIRRGQVIGGIVGIALNVIGGLFSLIGLFAH
jgi:hypothetical protein